MENQKKYEHFGQIKRDRLEALIDDGQTQKEIAKILEVNQSTISREISRNRKKMRTTGGTVSGSYESGAAEHKALVRRENSKYQCMKIEEDNDLRKYIIEKLENHWNPDEISNRMKNDDEPFYASKTVIYEWLRSRYGQRYCTFLYSQRYTAKKQRKNKLQRTLIPNRIGIESQPLGAINRSRYGHYEGDTIVSARESRSKCALSVIYERKSKYIDARRIKNMKPESHNQALKEMLENKKALSLTQDNGIENTKHQELGLATYFCDPYSSWQKGGIENANKMIRRYIPKGSDISDYSDEYVKMVITILNNKPRKSLGYKTANEVMLEKNLFRDINTRNYALEG
jgi:IS30 family transposase